MSIDARELHLHQARLRRLALAILGDATRADDAVQDTWLAAMKARAPRGDLGAWLAGILRHRARKLLRGEARRSEHEARAARSDGSHEDVELAVEHGRALYAALDRLDEPLRTVVVLRYLRDVSPPEIAERLGLPLETVRTRLRRGLARLRERLDREHAGWALAFLPLSSAPTTAGALAGSSAFIFGGWMAAKLIAVGVALALVVALVISTRPDAVAPNDTAAPLEEMAGVPAEPGTRAEQRAPDVAASARAPVELEAVPVEAALAPPVLRIAVTGWRDDDAGEFELVLARADQALGIAQQDVAPPLATLARRPRDGEIRLALRDVLGEPASWPATVELRADHADFLPARTWIELAREVETIEATLPLERAAFSVRGVARGPGGFTLDAGRAALFVLDREPFRFGAETLTQATPADTPEELVELDASGAFRLRSRSAGTHVLVVYDDFPLITGVPGTRPVQQLAPLTRRLPASGERELDLGTFELDFGLAIRGEVPAWRGFGGDLMASAPDAWMAKPALGFLRFVDGAFVRVWLDTRVDLEGRFELTGLSPVDYKLTASSRGDGDGSAPRVFSVGTEAEVTVRAPADDVVLEADLVRCELLVLAGGEPLVGATIAMRVSGASSQRQLADTSRITLEFGASATAELDVQHAAHEPRSLQLTRASIPPDGVVRVELEPAAPRAAFTLVPTGSAQTAIENLALVVDLRPLDAASEPAPPPRAFHVMGPPPGDCLEWRVGAKPPGVRLTRVGCGVRVEGLPAGRYALAVGPRLDAECLQAPLVHALELDLAPGADLRVDWPVVLGPLPRISIQGEPSEPITYVRLKDAAGEVEGFTWLQDLPSSGTLTWRAEPFPTGRSIAKGALAPGTYELELFRGGEIVHTHRFALALDGPVEIVVDVSGI